MSHRRRANWKNNDNVLIHEIREVRVAWRSLPGISLANRELTDRSCFVGLRACFIPLEQHRRK